MPEANLPQSNNTFLSSTAYLLAIIIALVIILSYTQTLLVPFIIAIFVWFIVKTIVQLLDRITFFRQRVPTALKSISAFGIIILTVTLMGQMLVSNIQDLTELLPIYDKNIHLITDQIDNAFSIDIITMVQDYLKEFDFSSIVMQTVNALTDVFSNTFIILLYAIFLLLEESILTNKLKAMTSSEAQHQQLNDLLGEISTSIGSYITLKTLVSFITGVLSYFALLLIGVEAPVFWAFIIFLLNYIPTIGSLIATVFPAIFALLQFGNIYYCLIVLGVVGFIQLIVGNFIEPRLMGNSLNISPLVVIISLSGWGALWGITGMILSVPLMVILIIILSKFPSTKPLAILLSEKGEIKDS